MSILDHSAMKVSREGSISEGKKWEGGGGAIHLLCVEFKKDPRASMVNQAHRLLFGGTHKRVLSYAEKSADGVGMLNGSVQFTYPT